MDILLRIIIVADARTQVCCRLRIVCTENDCRAFSSIELLSIGGWGVSLNGKSFRIAQCVRASMRAVWLPSGIGSQERVPTFSLFPLWAPSFPFSLLGR